MTRSTDSAWLTLERCRWHSRGVADALARLVAARYIARRDIGRALDLLNIDRADWHHANLRAKDYTE